MRNKVVLLGILVVALLSFFTVSKVYSLYSTKVEAEADINYAKFIFNSKKTDEVNIEVDDILPGDVREYNFQVTNSNDKNVKSDVSVKYNFYIESYRVLPLIFSVAPNNDKDNAIFTCGTTASITSSNRYYCKSNDLTLAYNEGVQDYVLKVSFPATNSSGEVWSDDYSGIIDYVNLKIRSWQRVS